MSPLGWWWRRRAVAYWSRAAGRFLAKALHATDPDTVRRYQDAAERCWRRGQRIKGGA